MLSPLTKRNPRVAAGPAERRGARLTAGLVVLIPVGLTLGLSAFAWTYDRTLPWAGLPLLLGASAVAALAWHAFARGLPEPVLLVAGAAQRLDDQGERLVRSAQLALERRAAGLARAVVASRGTVYCPACQR